MNFQATLSRTQPSPLFSKVSQQSSEMIRSNSAGSQLSHIAGMQMYTESSSKNFIGKKEYWKSVLSASFHCQFYFKISVNLVIAFFGLVIWIFVCKCLTQTWSNVWVTKNTIEFYATMNFEWNKSQSVKISSRLTFEFD